MKRQMWGDKVREFLAMFDSVNTNKKRLYLIFRS